jgi:fluoroquinolone resistance protein
MAAMDIQDLRSKLDGGDLIEGATFADMDWCDLDCENARFADCVIDQAQLSSTIFAGAKFSRCQFPRCRFSRADLSDAEFDECSFTVKDDTPVGCAFVFSDFRRARFRKCDLSLCQFERSDLFSVEMDKCNLRGARFHKVDFSHAFSRKVIVTRAIFRACNMELADLAEARLAECDFTDSRLREADLGSADLTDAILRDCDLFRAVLSDTKLAGADLRGAEISGLNLMALGSFTRMKINQGQQHILLLGIGLDVYPQPD